MARGIKGVTTSGSDWRRKPYISRGFHDMVKTPTNAAIWTERLEKHSEFEKPYVRGHNYAEMQHYHPSMFKVPYRGPEPDSNPLGSGVDPCRGTVHATLDGITAPVHYVDCGTSHAIGMDGGVPPFELGGVAGSLNGSVSGDTYTAPSCSECKDEVTDHIQVLDACGRTPNLIIKTKFGKTKVWVLDRTEVSACGILAEVRNTFCDEIVGDTLVRKYYTMCGSISGGSTCASACSPGHCDCPLSAGSGGATAPCSATEQCTSPLVKCWWALYMTEYYKQECA